jgi:protein gp37
MKNTKIEWAHHTVNFWWGCTKVSPACAHCYAETLAKMWSKGRATWGESGQRWLRVGQATRELLKLDKAAGKRGVRERVFINSMSDTFEDRRDLDGARLVLFAMAPCVPNLDLLLLTKRPERVRNLVPPAWLQEWPRNVWIGTTVENQAAADDRLPALLDVPARVRFLSCEPLLGPLEIEEHLEDLVDGGYVPGSAPIHWVIAGGESGGGARPMAYAWITSLRDQCAGAGVPFFFKQWGEFVPLPGNVPGKLTKVTVAGRKRRWQQHGDEIAVRIGKKEAGRTIDGVEYSAVPSGNTQVTHGRAKP